MTDKFSDHIYPHHPIRSQDKRTPVLAHDHAPSRPRTERIRQNPLHNVKQPNPGTQNTHHSNHAMRKINTRTPKQLKTVPCLRCDDLNKVGSWWSRHRPKAGDLITVGSWWSRPGSNR
jgi:hypothetical protein